MNTYFFIGFLILVISFPISVSALEPDNLTILKEWNKEDNLNGGFEALRRDWLAKVREIRKNKNDETQATEHPKKDININTEDVAIVSNQKYVGQPTKP